MQPTREFLLRTLAAVASPDEADRLLDDLCTPREVDELCLRLDIARRLYEGQTYEAIEQGTGASSTTISRVRRALFRGSGGYEAMLRRLLGAAGSDGR